MGIKLRPDRRWVVLTALLALGACGQKAVQKAPDITVENAWMRPPPAGRHISAAYLTIRNDGGADLLLSAASPLAKDMQMHISKMQDGVMSMEPEDTVSIPAHGTVIYKPGGRHFMVFGIKGGLKAGDPFPITLQFEKSGAISVTAIMGNQP